MLTTTSITSWLAKRILLALPLISLLFSCEEPTDIGLDVEPDSQVGVHFIDVDPVVAKTVYLDSIVTTGNSTQMAHLAGQIDDPEFGKITSTTYTELRLKDAGFNVGAGIEVDTVILQLNYLGAYGDKDQTLKLEVRRLAEKIERDTLYNNSSVAVDQANVLGTLEFVPSEKTPGKKRAFVSAGLEKSFGEAILAADFTNHASFRNSIFGIALVPVENSSSIATFGFDRDADTSYVLLNYRANGVAKSLKLYLDRPAKRFHSITADRAGTGIASLNTSGDVVESSASGAATYLQAGTGIRTVIKFPGLENLRDQIGSEIAVNDAHLILPVTGSDTADFAPPSGLFVAKSTSGNRILNTGGIVQLVPHDNKVVAAAYDRKKGKYVARIGTYFQKVLYGNEVNNGIIVFPTANSSQVARVRLKEPGPDGIKLRIYYTKVQ